MYSLSSLKFPNVLLHIYDIFASLNNSYLKIEGKRREILSVLMLISSLRVRVYESIWYHFLTQKVFFPYLNSLDKFVK